MNRSNNLRSNNSRSDSSRGEQHAEPRGSHKQRTHDAARDDDTSAPVGVTVPYDQLSADALRGVIEEFVTREGTDYGSEHSLEEKVEQVLAQLKGGRVAIVFSPADESCSIQPVSSLHASGSAQAKGALR